MNELGLGMKMSDVRFPRFSLWGRNIDPQNLGDIDNLHTSPSSIFAYLGVRGNGTNNTENSVRNFNAIPYLGYWDIYKQYYANKQEEIGYMIHQQTEPTT